MLKRKFNYQPVLFLLLGFFFFLNHEASASYLTAGDSQWSNNGTSIYYNDGFVGVGTTTPGVKLDVIGGPIRTNNQFISTLSNGTAPLVVTSLTTVTNLNADLLDGQHGSYYDQRVYNSATNYLGAGYVSGGTEKPNWAGFGAGKLKLQMLAGSNIGAPDTWNDVIWMSSYTGSDVKNSNALIFGKGTIDRIGFVRQAYDSTSWGTYREIFHTGNSNSSTIDWNAKNLYITGSIGIASSTPIARIGIASSSSVVINVGGGKIGGLDLTPINNDEAVPLGYLKSNYTSGGVSGSGTANYVTKWSATGTLANSLFYDNATNVGLGTTVPEAKLDVRGSSLSLNGAFYHYKNLASINTGSATGTLKITMPKTWSNSMMTVTIKGYSYSANGAWEVVVSGYNYSGPYWVNTSAEIRGKAPFTTVRLAHDGTKNVILLGATSTLWSYPKAEVSDFLVGHSAETGWGSGWTMSFITDETGISYVNTPVAPTYIDASGNMGIGTVSPGSYKLNVAGSAYFNGNVNISGANALLFPSYGGGWYMSDSTWIRTYGSKGIYQNAGTIRTDGTLQVGGSGSTLNVANGGTFAYNANTLFANTSGNVGIGTTSPLSKLSVSGGTGDVINVNGGSIAGLNLTPVNNDQAVPLGYLKTNYTQGSVSGSGTGGYISKWAGAAATSTIGNSNIYTNGTNVGIGTTVPNSSVHILAASPILRLANSSAVSSTTIGQIDFSDSYQPATAEARISAVRTVTGGGGNNPADLVFSVMNGTTLGEALRINSAGNVGIGTTNPTSRLDLGIQAPGINIPFSYFRGYSANANWPISMGSAYDASYAEQYLVFNGYLDGGTKLAPTFFGSGSGGSFIKDSRAGATTDGMTFGIFSNGAGKSPTEIIRIAKIGNVGIGTTNPVQKFQVAGNIYANSGNVYTDNGYALLSSDGKNGLYPDTGNGLVFKASSTEFMRINLSGNVGIGTTSPVTSLSIKNATYRQLSLNGGTGHQTLNLGSVESSVGSYIYNNAYYATSNLYLPSQASASGIQMRNDGSIDFLTDTGLTIGTNYSPTSRIKILNTGNIGIASTTPSVKLSIAGGTGDVVNAGGGHIIGLNSTPTVGTAAVPLSYLQSNYAPISGSVKGSGTGGYMTKWAGTAATSTIAQGLVYDNGTNVGIGTTVPGSKLSVQGAINIGAIAVASNILTASDNNPGSTIFTISRQTNNIIQFDPFSGGGFNFATGSVGIGVTNPTIAKLQVDFDSAANNNIAWFSGDNAALIIADNSTVGGAASLVGRTADNSGYNAISFRAGATDQFYLATSSYIGIGTTVPTTNLHVVGSGLFTEHITVGLTGTNKIYAGAVDPPYTIGGRKYATYAPSMTGIKEETAGVVTLKYTGQKDLYSYDLDLKNPVLASDLWLFSKVTNLKKEGLNKVSVLLSAHFDGRIWYEKNEASGLITIYAVPLENKFIPEVSYRLTAPRFDSLSYPSERPASDKIEGFNLDKLLK